MSTALGWNLIALPSSPSAPTTIEYRANDIVGATLDTYTGEQQFYDWGQGFWEWSVAYRPMMEAEAELWISFLLQLRGTLNVFQLGDPRKASPRGSGAGAPFVNGQNQTGFSLITAGWTPSQMGVLLPGDYLQIGYRMYRCTAIVNSDGGGNATIPIWPSLREIPNGGAGSPPVFDSIVLNNCQGLWRLKSNMRSWNLDVDGFYRGFTFEITEALGRGVGT